MLVAPRLQPATGTLLVAVSSRTAGSLPQSALMVHGGGQWVALGNVSGAVPAAPAERDLTVVSLPAGAYDGVRVGADLQNVSFTIIAGQVAPLLLGIDSGHLIPGSAYSGNDEVNLGLGELAGRFVAMPNYDLVDQAGHGFNPTTTSGKDLVIAAFHTTCHETCPLYTALFFQISKHLPANVTLAEVTTDPATDTPAALTDYGQQIGASWTFATGSAEALTAFWKPFEVELASGDSHVSTLALVDRHGYVRLVYRGVPDVGGAIPPALITGLSAQGLHELASGGDGWGAPDVLQSLLTIAGPQQPSPGAGGNAPAFTLTGTDGRQVSLASLVGRPAVINFWASYCPPCRAEMPLLQRDAGSKSGVQLVLVNEGDSGRVARDFLDSLAIHQPALLDSDLSVGHAYGAVALPTTVFIRADGTIAARHIGQLDAMVLAAQISNLVSK
ncbi:MAG TPA: redoxin family protein [Candidatus Dormibacteraeota bacterium]|nr:redoxin family protein [Candidatus Dormibacteraeota bacterium]